MSIGVMECKYSLEDNAFEKGVLVDLYQMRKQQQFCDTEIISSEGKTFHAHANILASRSDLLRSTFLSSLTSAYKINTEHISARVWESLLDFIYLGEVHTNDEGVVDLCEAASSLELTRLYELCQAHVTRIKVKQSEVNQEQMVTMETQTEEALMQYVSGETRNLDLGHTIGDEVEMENVTITDVSLDEDGGHLVASLEIQPETSDAAQDLQSSHHSNRQPTTIHEIRKGGTFITPVPVQDKIIVQEKHGNMTDSKTKKATPNRILHKDMLFKCGICDKFYSSKQGLERHAVLHTKGRNFTCEQCGKAFKLERYLQAHMQRHSEDRNFQCPVCGKAFKTQRDASWHTRTVHSNEKRHQCSHCNYAAKTKNLLTQHMLQHTHDKQFVCKTCGKSFLRKQHLEQHRQRHDGKREFVCNVCGAEFYTVYACKEHHMRIHQGLKKYECSICGQQYNEKKSFMKHLSKHSTDLVLTLDGSDIMVESGHQVESGVKTIVAGQQYSVINADDASVTYDAVGAVDTIVAMENNTVAMDANTVVMDANTVAMDPRIVSMDNVVVTMEEDNVNNQDGSAIIQYEYVNEDGVPIEASYIEQTS